MDEHRLAVLVCDSDVCAGPGSDKTPEEVAVVEARNITTINVKTRIITQSEVDEAIAPLLARLAKSGERVDRGKIARKALNELILTALREQKAEQLSIKVTEEQLDQLMEEVERKNKLLLTK